MGLGLALGCLVAQLAMLGLLATGARALREFPGLPHRCGIGPSASWAASDTVQVPHIRRPRHCGIDGPPPGTVPPGVAGMPDQGTRTTGTAT